MIRQNRSDSPRRLGKVQIGMSVSTVIPTFNRASVLERALESVFSQIDPPDEVIVVDDGSTDNTPEVCSRFGSKIRYIRQVNRGVAAARNRGIAAATGEYIAFLDSDDSWDCRKLRVQIGLLEKYPEVGWSVTDAWLAPDGNRSNASLRGFQSGFPVFEEGNVSALRHFGEEMVPIHVGGGGVDEDAIGFLGDVFDLLFAGNFVFPSCAVVRRQLFENVGLFNESFRVAEDTEFFHRLAADSNCIVVLEPLTYYCLGGDDALTRGANTIESVTNALDSIRRATSSRPLSEAGRRRKVDMERSLVARLAYAYLSEFRQAEARATIRRARAEGISFSWTLAALWGAAILPGAVLRVAGRVRRRI